MRKLVCTRGERYEYRDEESGEHFFSWSQVCDQIAPDLFTNVRVDQLEAARERGTELHLFFAFLMGSLGGYCERPEPLLGPYHPYCIALMKFADEERPEPLLIEQASCHPVLKVAGRPDLKCLLGPRRRRTLIDLKTGVPSRLHQVQCSVYHKFEDYKDVVDMRGLYINKHGKYKLEPFFDDPGDWATFIHGLERCRSHVAIANWRDTHGV